MNDMFIVVATSNITNIKTYFIGNVITRGDGTYGVQSIWSAERRFATMFRTDDLADKVANTFRKQIHNVTFSVEREEGL